MLARKEHSKKGKFFPGEWKNNIISLLNSNYENERRKNGTSFDAYGLLYEDEVLIIVSLLNTNNHSIIPVTCFLSADITPQQSQQKIDQLLTKMIDTSGVFFDEFFSAEGDWDEYSLHWEKMEFQSETLFYRIGRENMALTLEADRILESSDDFDSDNDDYKKDFE